MSKEPVRASRTVTTFENDTGYSERITKVTVPWELVERYILEKHQADFPMDGEIKVSCGYQTPVASITANDKPSEIYLTLKEEELRVRVKEEEQK